MRIATKKTFELQLHPYQGSEFDLWHPWKAGVAEPSIVRPEGAEHARYWAGHTRDGSKINAHCAARARALGFKFVDRTAQREYPSMSGDLDSPNLPELVAWLGEMKARRLIFPCQGSIELKLVESSGSAFEWFKLKVSMWDAGRAASHVGDMDRFSCRADAARPGLNIAEYHGIYVSESVKEVIEHAGLRGVEFIWARDTGKFRAPQWFYLVVKQPIGRGLDHPLFDSKKYVVPNPRSEREGRMGVVDFKMSQLRTNAPFDSAVQNQFLDLFIEPHGVRFGTYHQFLRQLIPDTDFAYGLNTGEFICFNRRTRDVLSEHGLLAEEDYEPLLVQDECPAGEIVFDSANQPVGPYWSWGTAAEFNAIRARNAAGYLEFLNHPKPPRTSSLARSLNLLQAAKKANPGRFRPGAKAADVSAAESVLKIRIPQAWVAVLGVSQSFPLETTDSFEVVAPAEMPRYQQEIEGAAACCCGENFPLNLLHVTTGGDFHSLDLASMKDGDCRVFEFDHESMEIRREWPSIATFIEEIAMNSSQNEPA